MSRYIDVDKLKEVFDEHEDDYGYLHGDWEEFIDNAPTADVVEVVRCKDCKYWKELLPVCERIHRAGWGVNDFCSFGERADT